MVESTLPCGICRCPRIGSQENRTPYLSVVQVCRRVLLVNHKVTAAEFLHSWRVWIPDTKRKRKTNNRKWSNSEGGRWGGCSIFGGSKETQEFLDILVLRPECSVSDRVLSKNTLLNTFKTDEKFPSMSLDQNPIKNWGRSLEITFWWKDLKQLKKRETKTIKITIHRKIQHIWDTNSCVD